MMSLRTAAIQKALLAKWSVAKAGAECLARKVLGEPRRGEDYLRGFQAGYWRGATDISQLEVEVPSKPGQTH